MNWPWEAVTWKDQVKFFGLPEWVADGDRHRLRQSKVNSQFYVSRWASERWRVSHNLTRLEVACLIHHDRAMKLWEKYRVYLSRFCGLQVMQRDIDGQLTEMLCKDGRFRETRDAADILTFADTDAAQSTAISCLFREAAERK